MGTDTEYLVGQETSDLYALLSSVPSKASRKTYMKAGYWYKKGIYYGFDNRKAQAELKKFEDKYTCIQWLEDNKMRT